VKLGNKLKKRSNFVGLVTNELLKDMVIFAIPFAANLRIDAYTLCYLTNPFEYIGQLFFSFSLLELPDQKSEMKKMRLLAKIDHLRATAAPSIKIIKEVVVCKNCWLPKDIPENVICPCLYKFIN
jgi:hypothetical protein